MIVIVHPELTGIHGIARYMQSFLSNIDAADAQVVVITVPLENKKDLAPCIKFIEIPIRKGRFGLVIWSLKARKAVKALTSLHSKATINYQCPPLIPALFGLPNKARTCVVTHSTYYGLSGASSGYKYFSSDWSWSTVFLKQMLEKWIFSKADKVITLTRQGHRELDWYKCARRIEIVPNGVDTTVFTPAEEQAKVFDVLFVGRLEKLKGSRAIAQLCTCLIDKMPEIRIGIVGEGTDFEYLQSKLAQFSGNVFMLGKLEFEKMPATYNATRLYLSVSYHEGLPGTCLEAMSTGRAVVVWDLPFYDDLVIDGKTGYRIKADDYSSFSKTVEMLLFNETLLESIAKNARAHVDRHYSWTKLAQRLINSIQK